jgi:hypothetical protein
MKPELQGEAPPRARRTPGHMSGRSISNSGQCAGDRCLEPFAGRGCR